MSTWWKKTLNCISPSRPNEVRCQRTGSRRSTRIRVRTPSCVPTSSAKWSSDTGACSPRSNASYTTWVSMAGADAQVKSLTISLCFSSSLSASEVLKWRLETSKVSDNLQQLVIFLKKKKKKEIFVKFVNKNGLKRFMDNQENLVQKNLE